MGFEAFQVRLRGGSATFAAADASVRGLPHAEPESGFLRASHYYTAGDGLLIVELEVSGRPTEISCRFAVCQPPAIDGVFLELVRELVVSLGMEAFIADETRPEHGGWFGPDRFEEFAAAVPLYTAGRRAEWAAQFGPEQFPASTADASRYVLERFASPELVTPPAE